MRHRPSFLDRWFPLIVFLGWLLVGLGDNPYPFR